MTFAMVLAWFRTIRLAHVDFIQPRSGCAATSQLEELAARCEALTLCCCCMGAKVVQCDSCRSQALCWTETSLSSTADAVKARRATFPVPEGMLHSHIPAA